MYAYSGGATEIDRDELGRIRDHMTVRGPDGVASGFRKMDGSA